MSVLDRICRFPYKGESGLMIPGREGNVMEGQRWKDKSRGTVHRSMLGVSKILKRKTFFPSLANILVLGLPTPRSIR